MEISDISPKNLESYFSLVTCAPVTKTFTIALDLKSVVPLLLGSQGIGFYFRAKIAANVNAFADWFQLLNIFSYSETIQYPKVLQERLSITWSQGQLSRSPER